MRKTLLVVCALIMALSVSAQGFRMLSGRAKPLSAKTFKMGEYKVVTPECTNNVRDMSKVRANAKVVAASVASQADLYGNYVEEDAYSDGDLPDYCPASLNEYDYNGTKYVQLIGFSDYIDALGTYDVATKKLTFEPQICCQDEEYGNLALYGITAISGNNVSVDVLTFTVGDDGVLKSDQIGIALVITEGQYANYLYARFLGTISLLPPNAVQAGTIQNPKDATAGPEAYKFSVRVEDNVTSVRVKGFCISGALDINVKEDGTVSIPTKQEILYLGLENQSEILEYGEYACFTGVTDGAIDYEKASVPGTISGNVITITEPFSVCSLTPAGGSPMSMGIFPAGTTITLDNGNYASGIKDITASREEAIKNAKAYNIMGQRVDANNAKGLIIVNGKKYLKK